MLANSPRRALQVAVTSGGGGGEQYWVALSGGGHRASLFGLGMLLYLVTLDYPLLSVPERKRFVNLVS